MRMYLKRNVEQQMSSFWNDRNDSVFEADDIDPAEGEGDVIDK